MNQNLWRQLCFYCLATESANNGVKCINYSLRKHNNSVKALFINLDPKYKINGTCQHKMSFVALNSISLLKGTALGQKISNAFFFIIDKIKD